MKKTARVIVTLACNRKCPGCCNETIGKVASIGDISVLSDYEEVVITGGEPMLNPDSLLRFIKALKSRTNGRECICTRLVYQWMITERSLISWTESQ